MIQQGNQLPHCPIAEGRTMAGIIYVDDDGAPLCWGDLFTSLSEAHRECRRMEQDGMNRHRLIMLRVLLPDVYRDINWERVSGVADVSLVQAASPKREGSK